MAKIVQLKMAGADVYPRTTTDQIAFVREDNDGKDKENSEE